MCSFLLGFSIIMATPGIMDKNLGKLRGNSYRNSEISPAMFKTDM